MTAKKKIALIDWTHCIEDYLDNIGLTLDDFAEKMQGGWLFGYIEALQLIGIETTFFCFSKNLKTPCVREHRATKAIIHILPVPKIYNYIRRTILNPYTSNIHEAAMPMPYFKRGVYSFILKINPYCATPFFKLKTALNKNEFDILLCQEYEHARFDMCVLIAKWLKIPVFATFQGGNWQLSPYEKYIRRCSLNNVKGLIIASERENKRMLELYPFLKSKIHSVFNPIEKLPEVHIDKITARQKLNIPPQLKMAIWHGRIDFHRKGLDRLIEAWQLVKSENAILYIIGNGTDRTILEKKLKESNNPSIFWINEYIQDREDIYRYLYAADIYVFLSRNEGFPAAPIEAMAAGLPVMATAAPGITEILEPTDKSGGILLPIDSATEDIALHIDSLFKSDIDLKIKSNKAQAHVATKFSMQAIAQQFKGVFK